MIIPIQNQYSYNNLARNYQLKKTIASTCNVPEKTLLVDWKGDCFLCSCESWLPVSAGKITDFNRLDDVWSSTTAKTLQQDLVDKKFSHCAVQHCGIVDRDIILQHHVVSINIDESCNLWCPSCRKEKKMLLSGPEFELKTQQVQHLVQLLEDFDQPTQIIMSGNGDVLASSIMRPLLHNFKPRPNHKIKLFTNGLLLRKQLENNPVLQHINNYLLSIDAGSADVYEKVRLGGRWSVLLDNFDFLRDHVKPLGANISLTFVVQAANYHDMANFADLCISYGFNGGFTKLEDWGTWPDFDNQNVIGNRAHPSHCQAIDNLKKVFGQYHNQIHFDSALSRLAQS